MYDAGMGRDPVPREPPDLAGAAQVGTHPAARFERDEIDALMAFMKVL